MSARWFASTGRSAGSCAWSARSARARSSEIAARASSETSIGSSPSMKGAPKNRPWEVGTLGSPTNSGTGICTGSSSRGNVAISRCHSRQDNGPARKAEDELVVNAECGVVPALAEWLDLAELWKLLADQLASPVVDPQLFQVATSRAYDRRMKYLIAIILPPIGMLLVGKSGKRLLCLIY